MDGCVNLVFVKFAVLLQDFVLCCQKHQQRKCQPKVLKYTQTSDDCVRQMISFKIANEKKKIMMRREMIIHPSSFMGTELPNMD